MEEFAFKQNRCYLNFEGWEWGISVKKIVAFLGSASLVLGGYSAQAITITAATTSFFVNDPGLYSPVCEVQTSTHILRGTDDDFFYLNDSYFVGVTDASGTIGVNNVGAPIAGQHRAVQVGVTQGGVGFIDRNDVSTPKYMTIWEGVEDPMNPGSFIKGAMVFQQQIPQALILANCQGSNQAPTAAAGNDQTLVVPGSTVMLNGSASTDPDNDTLTYAWTQISGPVVVLSDPTSATPSFIAPGGTNGTPIIFQLVVHDGTVASSADTVMIGVQDNVLAAQAAIGSFLPERAQLLLSHQPDMQRRIDRLQGRGGAALTGAGSASGRLPLEVRVNGSSTSVRSSLNPGQSQGAFDVWFEGSLSDVDLGGRDADLMVAHVGADYVFSDRLLVGVMGQYDDLDYASGILPGVTGGTGWMVGPYALVRLSGDVFLDMKVSTGASRNQVRPFGTYEDSFKTRRNLIMASLVGEHELSPGLLLRTDASVSYLLESQKGYVDALGSTVAGQDFAFGLASVAPRLMYTRDLSRNWVARPYIELRGLYTFGDEGGAFTGEGSRLRSELGMDLLSTQGQRLSVSGYYDGIGQSAYQATGFRVTGSMSF